MKETAEVRRIVHRTAEEGDHFYFYGGVNGYYMESTLGRVRKAVEEYQAYELQPLGCHYHGDGCHPDIPEHMLVTRTHYYAQVFGGQDSIHTELDLRNLRWNKEKQMWNAGSLA